MVSGQIDPDCTRYHRAIAIFKRHGGILRTAQAIRAGIHPATLYAMRDSGELDAG